jgi:hypothetical protein
MNQAVSIEYGFFRGKKTFLPGSVRRKIRAVVKNRLCTFHPGNFLTKNRMYFKEPYRPSGHASTGLLPIASDGRQF